METQKYTKKLAVVKKFVAYTQSLKIVGGQLEQNSVDGYVRS